MLWSFCLKEVGGGGGGREGRGEYGGTSGSLRPNILSPLF